MAKYLLMALTAVALAGCAAAPAANREVVPLNHLPALAGDYFPLPSKEAKHLYHIYVRLPEGYDANSDRRYPVVYLLDGDSLFPIVAATHLFLTIDDNLPEAIVVGIAYGSFAKPTNRRHIDFMPPGSADESGIVAFQRFLKNELLPTVEGRYRVDPERRILFGQSRAGALILYSAYTQPDLFWAHVASNPSWKPGQEMFFGPAPRPLRKDLRLVIATGTEEYPDRRATAQEWFGAWQVRGGAPWQLKQVQIPGGTHSANSADAYRGAMRWLFPVQPDAQ